MRITVREHYQQFRNNIQLKFAAEPPPVEQSVIKHKLQVPKGSSMSFGCYFTVAHAIDGFQGTTFIEVATPDNAHQSIYTFTK